MSASWYESFFGGVVVDMWRAAVPPERTLAEVAFLEAALDLEAGSRVLDVPCGHGRHAVLLADRGYLVTGLDLSAAMLEHARESAGAAGVEVDWRHTEMSRLADDERFRGIYCFGNSFGYLGPEGDRRFLARVAAALESGGRFALHTGMVAECVLPRLEERSWSPMGELLFLEENRYDATESCLETTYTFVREGRTESRTARHWVYTTRELRELLAGVGLEVRGIYSSLEQEPFELDSPELFLISQKN